MAGTFVAAALWAVAFLSLMLIRGLWAPPYRYVLPAIAVLPFCYVYAAYVWERTRTRYRLTTQRLFRSEGVLFRRGAELELIRVDDVTVDQSLMDRIFSTGTVIVYSTDTTDPVLRLESIDRPYDVKELIRNAVVERRRGSIYVERI
jgi:uncharacterized membrane protein YdbT with pleckstrin-like domain